MKYCRNFAMQYGAGSLSSLCRLSDNADQDFKLTFGCNAAGVERCVSEAVPC